jgi:beta-xylosidase
VLAALVVAVLVPQFVPTPAQAALPVAGPVLDRDFPDPDLVRVGSTYYAYATESRATSGGGPTLQRARSTDLRNWTYIEGGALDLPAWAAPGYTWAPEVFQRADGRMVMWFTARHAASGRQCIGVATAAGPESRFVPTGSAPAICPTSEGGAIDAASFLDGSQRYILWKTDGNCCGQDTWIVVQPVAADGVTLTGQATRLIKQDRSFEGALVEAPTMWKTGSTYVLAYSANDYAGGSYLTSYARSTSVTGGFVKAPSPLLTTDKLDNRIVGPGGQDIVVGPDGRTKIVVHGWRNGTSYRAMYVQDLGFANGYPVVAGAAVQFEAEDFTINNASVRRDAAGASNGAVVGYIDYDDSFVEFRDVYVPATGTVTLRLRYAAGAGDASYAVTVDGSSQGSVALPATGWDNWRTASKDVQLSEGFHTIRFGKGTAYAELDRLDVL